MIDSDWNLDTLYSDFIDLYGDSKEELSVFFAPGRVNLIGEHTDYNGGYVFPCSLHFGTYLLLRKTDHPTLTFTSKNTDTTEQVYSELEITPFHNSWVNYPLGVIKEFRHRGIGIPGYQMLFAGNIPNSAGLSSSASIEMVTAVAFNSLENLGFERMELVKLCQHAENEFVGMKCGIMDQFAVGMGQKDKALFLNCDTLAYELVPLEPGKYNLVITNTNKPRRLAESKYNERRSECEKAVRCLQSFKPIRNLSEMNEDEFSRASAIIDDTTVRKRARHVITENQRVLQAVEVLKNNDLLKFGELMYQSHRSLKDDYEVSCFELDTLVEEASKINGVAGSRMTGAGFGGCTVSLVHQEAVDKYIFATGKNYKSKTGLEASFFVARIGDGARQIKVQK